jgi:hypothetical protein
VSDAHDTPIAPPALPALWVFALSAVVILAAFISVLLWLFSASAAIQYPIILALVCFVLSSVSCLLFASQTKIQSTLPIAAITIGGPAVTWVATLLIVSYLFPAPTLTPQNFVDVLRAQHLRQGWKTFPDWTNQFSKLRWMILRDEANHVRQAMDTAYYLGPSRHKLANPNMQLLFVYGENSAVKIARIRGKTNDVADIFFKGSTTQAGGARSVIFAKSGENVTVASLGGDSDWETVRTEDIDCLILTLYTDEGMLPEGDILYVETNKYRQTGSARIDVGILAPQSIRDPSVWLVDNFPFPLPDEVPVIYKKAAAVVEESVDSTVGNLTDWLTLLDQPAPSGRAFSPEIKELLQTIKSKLPQSSFSSIAAATNFKTKVALHLDQITNAVAIAFETK